jgi:hypothetical protein
MVATVVPDATPPPAAMHVLVLGQLIPLRMSEVPALWADQVPPPLVVARIVPSLPTAKHVLTLGQLIPWRLYAVPEL